MDNLNVERLKPEQEMTKNGAFVILYSDDFENDAENKKVLMMLHWNGVFGFVGKEKEDNESFFQTLVEATKEQVNFDITPYEKEIKHLASYNYNGYGIHTYVCKITPDEMKQIRTMAHGSENSVFNYSAITVFNISPQTVENVLNNNFGATSGMDLFEFIDIYISPEFERIMNEHKEVESEVNVSLKEAEVALEGIMEDISLSKPENKQTKGPAYSFSFKPNV